MVLPDQVTVIGVSNDNDRKCLVMENLKAKNASTSCVEFGSHENKIQSLLLMGNADTLLAGDDAKQVIQYSRGSSSGAWTRQKHYGNLGVGNLRSSANFGHLAVFGGNAGKVRFLDVKNREIFGNPFETAIKDIFSLELFSNTKAETFLAVGGEFADYSEKASDIFRITQLTQTLQIEATTNNQSQTVKVLQNLKSQKINKKENKKCTCDVKEITQLVVAEVKNYIDERLSQMLSLLKNQLSQKGNLNFQG